MTPCPPSRAGPRPSGSADHRSSASPRSAAPHAPRSVRRHNASSCSFLQKSRMRSMERRLVAPRETVWHTLLTLEDSAALWLATEVEAQQARRSECRTRRSSGESPCRECCEQRLVIAGALESAPWRVPNRPRCAASRHCREGGANAPTATPEGSS